MSIWPSCPSSVSTTMPQNDETDSFKYNNTMYQTSNGQCYVTNQDLQQIRREDLNTGTQSLGQDVSPNQNIFEEIRVEDENARKINALISVRPENAVAIFRTIKRGCVCKVEELPCPLEKIYSAVFSHEDVTLATGLGTSEKDAEEMAAENGIQLFVSELMNEELKHLGKKLHEIKDQDLPSIEKVSLVQRISAYSYWKSNIEKIKLEIEMSKPPSAFTEANKKLDGWFERIIKVQYPTSALNWKSVHSFAALYVMKWHLIRHEKDKLNEKETMKGLEAANFITGNQNEREERKLPANAHELHPPDLLNRMLPGICAQEISRRTFKIKMGYKVKDKLYIGKGSTKKEAKAKAAVKVMEDVYDFHYPTKKTD